MMINSIKGTVYDLLGYFAPGLISWIGGVVISLQLNQTQDILTDLRAIIRSLSVFEAFAVIVASYVLGHVIASVSSWLIEKNLMKRIHKLNQLMSVERILGDSLYGVFQQKYETVFNTPYQAGSVRSVICYVQSKQPAVYETSMTFLAFYGMARSFALVFTAFSIAEAILTGRICENIRILALLISLSLAFFYEYIRFRKYYLDTIGNGFLLPETEH